MNRRDFNIALGAATALAALSTKTSAQAPNREDGPSYAMLVHPKMIMQDLVGPMTVFNLTFGTNHLVGKTTEAVITDLGIPVTPNQTYATCPRDVDALFVPGGLAGTIAMLQDEETLEFLRDVGSSAQFVTSVCTGSLLLGAAGLLKYKRATSHWYTQNLLSMFGAIPTEGRVVEDGNVITGGGVTAGIDFGFTLAAKLRGEDWARRVMLTLEYAPEPPFQGGTPALAGPEITNTVLQRRGPVLEEARQAARVAASKL